MHKETLACQFQTITVTFLSTSNDIGTLIIYTQWIFLALYFRGRAPRGEDPLLKEMILSQKPALLNSNSIRNARKSNTWATGSGDWATTARVIELKQLDLIWFLSSLNQRADYYIHLLQPFCYISFLSLSRQHQREVTETKQTNKPLSLSEPSGFSLFLVIWVTQLLVNGALWVKCHMFLSFVCSCGRTAWNPR